MTLSALLDQLQLQKSDLLADLESWSLEGINYRPSSQEWSALEVLDHLVRTEVEILAAARRGLSKPHRIGVTDALRTRFIQNVFRTDRKVKVPATANLVLPGSNLELPVIAKRWSEGRQELSHLLTTGAESELNKGIFRHPVCGWMGMPQILNFFSVHIVHHNYQLARLRTKLAELTRG